MNRSDGLSILLMLRDDESADIPDLVGKGLRALAYEHSYSLQLEAAYVGRSEANPKNYQSPE